MSALLELRAGNPYRSWCQRCQAWHLLPQGKARLACELLMVKLALHKRLDYLLPAEQADPRSSTAPLFAPAGGKMFGVLVCLDQHGAEHTLQAFSGQYAGRWRIAGWVEPVFDWAAVEAMTQPVERRIKQLSAAILEASSETERRPLKDQRRQLSRALMRAIHDCYELRNARGEQRRMPEFFPAHAAPPSGAGDCCAPKLIQQAFRNHLRPLSMAEFYWGASGIADLRRHASFYPPCGAKCQPLLGYMLCGLQS